ncbi:GlcG/HbpS family heme-binding protein [Pyrobaculum aerophilum]|uniref:GlcG homolog n=2 Tax=Pyrobaculum aerophilum TaxID=13773 RepID=Q8ZUP1_PYRAE|nr:MULTISPECIES: heme-binding protein [Pyrobaculum]AAL64365.1 glcG homolog [Pyrobaculum aerophilum str. IM2]MCX8136941.1 heme-binding protein [Pyrobaculum aerophilum]RFA97585.1 heme-degrading domain-containing protein [Pyrobaculum aerophilum]RFA99340.1 heme-degrading domain-containing protein [Pyrobaculum aerophilum]HII46768.1 heme-binding protein [Pyrobaculum aerophilum]
MKVFQAIASGVAKAEQLGVRVAIALVDEAGEVVALYKMPGAYPFSPKIALLKARTAAIFKRPTAELMERAAQNLPFYIGLTVHAGLIFGKGGIYVAKREFSGGVGVSGGTGDQDEEVARAVAQALD